MAIISGAIVWILESTLGRAILKILWDDLSGVVTNWIAKKKDEKAIDAAAKKAKDDKDPKDLSKLINS